MCSKTSSFSEPNSDKDKPIIISPIILFDYSVLMITLLNKTELNGGLFNYSHMNIIWPTLKTN